MDRNHFTGQLLVRTITFAFATGSTPREHSIKWPWDWQISSRWSGFATQWEIGLERGLQISSAPPEITKVCMGPLMEKGTIVLTGGLLSHSLTRIWPQLWGLGVDRWYGPAGQDKNHRQGWCFLRILLLLALGLMVMIFPVIRLLNIFPV